VPRSVNWNDRPFRLTVYLYANCEPTDMRTDRKEKKMYLRNLVSVMLMLLASRVVTSYSEPRPTFLVKETNQKLSGLQQRDLYSQGDNGFHSYRLSGYSCLTVLPDMSIACLYERGEKVYCEKLTFCRFTLDWLSVGKDSLKRSSK